jgi:hypothetical protein
MFSILKEELLKREAKWKRAQAWKKRRSLFYGDNVDIQISAALIRLLAGARH